ncbi:MAG: hypothetical protein AAF892_01185 [Cyanobacteria bacterium P01_D01_bin.71]
MTDSTKASRATVQLGSMEVDGFQLPDGSYRMSQTQAAEIIGLTERDARHFLDSKGIKAPMIEVDSFDQASRGTRIKALTLEQSAQYWMHEASKGNLKAIALVENLVNQNPEAISVAPLLTSLSKRQNKQHDSEAREQARLAKKLNGKTAVVTPVGKADLVTESEIIEVKLFKNWQRALGQVLAYGTYFPEKQKRIHLVGSVEIELLKKIIAIASNLSVRVSLELLDLQEENERLEQQIREMGGEPLSPSNIENA